MAEKTELQYTRWSDIELEQLNPLLQRRFVVGQEIMYARIMLKKDCLVPMHQHTNEQLTHVLTGALQFTIDGRKIVVRPGELLCIPSNMPHEALALEDTDEFDIFTPPRQDWITKNDAYLRGKK